MGNRFTEQLEQHSMVSAPGIYANTPLHGLLQWRLTFKLWWDYKGWG